MALRPPIRFAEPGSAWIVVIPPAMAGGILGALGAARLRGLGCLGRGLRRLAAPRGGAAPGERREDDIRSSAHRASSVLGYLTSSTTNGWPVNSVLTTRRGVVVVTYITNGTREPVTSTR